MRPLSLLTSEEARRVQFFLFDLDDTLLTHGLLTRDAYDALWSLRDAGMELVAVTGRPAGWGDVIARQWPVLGVVAENGGALIHRENQAIVRWQVTSDRARLDALVQQVRRAFPDVSLADDVDARRTDVTFDVGERFVLPRDRVDALRAFVTSLGARCTVSSIHLHASFEPDDKASGALRLLCALRGLDVGRARARSLFVGDSGNDAACFATFGLTVGVANVARHVPYLSIPPRYVTTSPMGAGFAELGRHVVGVRA